MRSSHSQYSTLPTLTVCAVLLSAEVTRTCEGDIRIQLCSSKCIGYTIDRQIPDEDVDGERELRDLLTIIRPRLMLNIAIETAAGSTLSSLSVIGLELGPSRCGDAHNVGDIGVGLHID